MSIQAGIWNFDNRSVDATLIAEFHSFLKDLGPDGEASWSSGPIALLYRPFHTTMESHREKQPYVFRDGFVLTWDGRLDSRDELAIELLGYNGSDQSDATLVATAFDHWGSACFRRIIGDWAVSIWNPKKRELILATDCMSIRHIFYYLHRDHIWWCTDLSPLVLLSHDTLHVDDDYIAGYFAHEPDAELTPYREIREVPPGHLVCIRDRRTHVECYWRRSTPRITYKTDADYEEHFRHVFRQSVRRRLRCDSPVLAELSGGLDSSSIVCVADDILDKEGAQTPRLDTLSYFDNTEPSGDDSIFFQIIEKKRGRVGAHIDVSVLGNSPSSFRYPEFASLPGHLGAGRPIEAERASIARSGGYRVVLSGLGGDEFMGGIPDPRTYLADFIVQGNFIKLVEDLTAWSLIKHKPWIQLFWESAAVLLPRSLNRFVQKEATVENWIDEDFARRMKIPDRLLGPPEEWGLWTPSQRAYLSGLVLMSNKMAKIEPPRLGLEELRYPYLDRDLITFILSIPASQLLRPGERRSLMRRSLVNYVPSEVLARRTKQLGARTHIRTIESNWEELENIFRSPLTAQLGYIDRDKFLECLRRLRNGTMSHLSRLQRAISLELWTRDLARRQLLDAPAACTLERSVGSFVGA